MPAQLKRLVSQLRQSPALPALMNFGLGIEKESLRVSADGKLSHETHPEALGAPLTHPYITTDFSEALLEFITPVFHNPKDALAFLENLHLFTYQNLPEQELLWVSSMPCILGDNDTIPLARYGKSNIGRMKTLYRSGLGYRYGRSMQTIAGIHFNFSFSDEFWSEYQIIKEASQLSLKDFKTDQYFHLIRNFKRYSWLLIYLFGGSPAICKSFVSHNPEHGLEEFDHGSLYAPYGTSLRMSDLGYTSEAQSNLYICYNSLDTYAEGLSKAIHTPYEPYQAFGPEKTESDGWQYKQLNDSILQIENEFYSTIRPKRVTPSGKKPLQVLQEDGVDYVEVRCLDLNPFQPLGIDETEMHFMTCFLTFCLLRESPQTNCQEFQHIEDNLATVVKNGRKPELMLHKNEVEVPLKEWASEILYDVKSIATLFDENSDNSNFAITIDQQLAKVHDPELTPSARVLARMKKSKVPYFQFAMDQSLACKDYFDQKKMGFAVKYELEQQAKNSISKREAIEAEDRIDFDTYLENHNNS